MVCGCDGKVQGQAIDVLASVGAEDHEMRPRGGPPRAAGIVAGLTPLHRTSLTLQPSTQWRSAVSLKRSSAPQDAASRVSGSCLRGHSTLSAQSSQVLDGICSTAFTGNELSRFWTAGVPSPGTLAGAPSEAEKLDYASKASGDCAGDEEKAAAGDTRLMRRRPRRTRLAAILDGADRLVLAAAKLAALPVPILSVFIHAVTDWPGALCLECSLEQTGVAALECRLSALRSLGQRDGQRCT